jgi:hypothetical protein
MFQDKAVSIQPIRPGLPAQETLLAAPKPRLRMRYWPQAQLPRAFRAVDSICNLAADSIKIMAMPLRRDKRESLMRAVAICPAARPEEFQERALAAVAEGGPEAAAPAVVVEAEVEVVEEIAVGAAVDAVALKGPMARLGA